LRKKQKSRKNPLPVFADYRLNCLNTQTEALLKDLGLAGITLSLENDRENLEDILKAPAIIPRIIYLYGQPPLFSSRFNPAGFKDNQLVESPHGERFRFTSDRETCRVFAERPIFFRTLLKMKPAGIKAFIVDLEFSRHSAVQAREIKEAITRGRPIKGSSSFNLDRKLY